MVFYSTIGTSPSSPGAISSVTLVGSPKKVSPVKDPNAKKKPAKDNDTITVSLVKDESIEMVEPNEEDVKFKEEEQEKNKKKPDDKFKISQRFSEVNAVHDFNAVVILVYMMLVYVLLFRFIRIWASNHQNSVIFI